MANPQITTTPVSTAFSTTNTSTATTSATNWSAQSLTGPAVSSTNALSDGMNTTNIVQSNITRKVPYSSYSINFDRASTDYMSTTAGSSSILSGATSCVVSLWFNANTVATGVAGLQPFVSNTNTNKTHNFRWWDSTGTNGRVQFYLYINSSYSFVQNTNAFTPLASTWYNFVGLYDGTNMKLYINGLEVGTTAVTGSVGTTTESDNFGVANQYNLDGKLSNVAYWKNQVLTEEDILNLYNNGVTQDLNNFRITPTAWYPMDQSYTYFNGSVLVARDTIGGRDGTGVNLVQSDIHGTAPGSEASGTGVNLTIADLKGNMYNSDKNAYSINMADYADGVTNPANSGRSTDTPS